MAGRPACHLTLNGELEGVGATRSPRWDDMTPLRLATLDASSFCFGKRGGIAVARGSHRGGGELWLIDTMPLRADLRAKGEFSWCPR